MWDFLLKHFLPKFSSLAAAQKEKFETEKLILNADHEQAIGVLKAKGEKQATEIDRLKKELSERPKKSHSLELSEIETTILVLVAKNEDGTSQAWIAKEAGLSTQQLKFYVTKLEEEHRFIDNDWNYGNPSSTLRQEGRSYLHKRNLLK